MKFFPLAFAGLMAFAALAPAAEVRCSAIPAQSLLGTWTFSTSGFPIIPTLFVGSVGNFTASITPSGRNILSITATSATDATVTRYETDAGSFQVNSDCTGGTLTFNLSSRPVQFEFYFVNSDEIVLISNSGNRTDNVVGTARRQTIPLVCPSEPLSIFTGPWVFTTSGFKYSFPIQSSAGRFVASVGLDRALRPLGLLAINATSVNNGSPTRQEQDAGRYQINADCSGGTLTFNLSSRPVQFDFWFDGPNRIVMISSNQGDIIVGSARRAGSLF